MKALKTNLKTYQNKRAISFAYQDEKVIKVVEIKFCYIKSN